MSRRRPGSLRGGGGGDQHQSTGLLAGSGHARSRYDQLREAIAQRLGVPFGATVSLAFAGPFQL